MRMNNSIQLLQASNEKYIIHVKHIIVFSLFISEEQITTGLKTLVLGFQSLHCLKEVMASRIYPLLRPSTEALMSSLCWLIKGSPGCREGEPRASAKGQYLQELWLLKGRVRMLWKHILGSSKYGMFGRTSEEEKAPLSSQALVLGLELLYHRSQNDIRGTYLVVQWLRICLAMQGTQVQFLVGELRSHIFGGN